MLRRVLVIAGAGLLVAGAYALGAHAYGAALYLLAAGGASTAGVLFERWRYTPPPPRIGSWQATGERFLDPGSGKFVQVYFNSDTGERHYRAEDAHE